MICDVCNAEIQPGSGARISNATYSKLLLKGFGIHPSNLSIMMAGGISEEEARLAYSRYIAQSESEWLLCGNCVEEAKAKRGVPAPKRTAEDEAILNHSNIISRIDDMASFQEDAIRERDLAMWQVFDRLSAEVWAFLRGKIGNGQAIPPAMRRYMLSSSFMAAGFTIEGNNARRYDLAQSFAMLVSRLGCDPHESFLQHTECERKWVALLRRTDLFSSSSRSCVPCIIVLAIPLVAAALWLVWK